MTEDSCTHWDFNFGRWAVGARMHELEEAMDDAVL